MQRQFGCCSHLDLDTKDDLLLIAENSRHRVNRFSFDGERKDTWGRRDRESLKGFAACCNPVNFDFGPGDVLYTAESGVGRVKKYSADGKYLGMVGYVDTTVFDRGSRLASQSCYIPVEVNRDASRIYVMDVRAHIVRVAGRETRKRRQSLDDFPIANFMEASPFRVGAARGRGRVFLPTPCCGRTPFHRNLRERSRFSLWTRWPRRYRAGACRERVSADMTAWQAFLSDQLQTPVEVVFEESLQLGTRRAKAPLDLIIGKRSMVEFDAKKANAPLRRLAQLTGTQGRTTVRGAFVVLAKSPIKTLKDLKGRTLMFGPEADAETHAAARAKLIETKLSRGHRNGVGG